MAIQTMADRYDAVTVELQEEVNAVFFRLLSLGWSLKDARTADELAPKHWTEEASRYRDWPGDDMVRRVKRINRLMRRAMAAGESLVSGRG